MPTEEILGEIMPYMCLFIDAGLYDIRSAARQCFKTNHDRKVMIQELQNMWTTHSNPNPVLPCLSVRTGFDLFFRVMNFPPGSEVIMSAVNIPDMVRIVKHHKLHIVPLDISIETAAPKVELLQQLVSSRTVAIVIAHLYGKWCPMDDIVDFAKKQNLYVIEDCAECFSGFDKLGHPESDLVLFSFGIIKFYTSFGGAIAKIRPSLYGRMVALYDTYPMQRQTTYLQKVLKYAVLYCLVNVTAINKKGIQLMHVLGINDYKDIIGVKMLRGFPDNMVEKIRERPCGALLATMLRRQRSFSPSDFYLQHLKGEYVVSRLPPSLDVVGSKATVNNYWLFPVIAENPDNLVPLLNALGVDAYRGATQLNIVEPDNGIPEPFMAEQTDHRSQQDCRSQQDSNVRGQESHGVDSCPASHVPAVNRQYPHEAKYLIDHVLYLPIHKRVPFHILNRMLRAINIAVALDKSSGDDKVKVVMPSKL